MTNRLRVPSLHRPMTRRAALGVFSALGGAVVLACNGVDGTTSDDGDGGSGTTGGGTTGGSTSATGGGTTGGHDASAGSATAWAQGGTSVMSGNYADPFTAAISACVVATAVTEGPCTEAADRDRKDISEGYPGLPMRLALKVVDASCNPVAGAKVKIWHTQITGSYSGDTPNNGMCLKSSAEGTKHYFRGVQTTDAAGRVDFDSCFPGWYRGRAIHIHYSVTAGGRTFTSQLAFDQALINELFASHPEYAGYGAPDTPNATDNIVGGAKSGTFVLDTSRLDDGALMAAKVLVVSV